MSLMESKQHLTGWQIFIRTVSLIVCGVGASACGYSLTMQVTEVGNITASVTWFSGLTAVVFALAAYAVSTDPATKSHIPFAIVFVLMLGTIGTILMRLFLYVDMVIYIALIAAFIQLIFLVVYHYKLKRQDPDAL